MFGSRLRERGLVPGALQYPLQSTASGPPTQLSDGLLGR
jgi:hypothetical protein